MRSIRILAAVTGVLSFFAATAQPIGKSSYEMKLQAGAEKLAEKDYYNALDQYELAYEESQDKALTPIIAEIHYLLRDYEKAERWYSRLFQRDKKDEFVLKRFEYGRMLKMNGKCELAIAEFKTFLEATTDEKQKELANNEIAGCEMAAVMPENAKGVKVESLGKNINTGFSEYSPAISPDGNTLYLSAFEPTKEAITIDDDNKDTHQAKIYKAGKEKEGWAKPTVLDVKINRPGFHNVNVSFAPDGKRMYFTRAVLTGTEVSAGAIYVSEGSDGNWMAPNEVQGVNGAFISKDPAVGELFGKEVLFFVSNMEGGQGGYDLYYATHKGGGVYADPVNLGPKINTPGNEITPHYLDGTLYFSSTGHPGIGGLDVFFSVWDGSTWSEPKNMGKPYNTSVDDFDFYIDQEGYNGFLTSNRPGGSRSIHGKTCCDDIYGFNIARLYADLVVGIFDESKKALTGATVELVEMTNEMRGTSESKTAGEKGNRLDFGLGLEKPYMIVATKEGYYPDSTRINTAGLKDSKTFEHRFFLKAKPVPPEYDTITSETPILLENILYDYNKDIIKKEAESDLTVVKELMTEYPDMKIELSSHTDNRGKDDFNMDLSQRRAESARRWLIRNGIARDRIEVKGYGETKPKTVTAKFAAQFPFLKAGDVLTEEYINKLATDEQKEAAHAINRRTEFTITAGPTSIVIKSTRLRKQPEVKPQPKGKNALVKAPAITVAPVGVDTVKISDWSSLARRKNKSIKGVPVMQFTKRYVDFGKVKKGEKRYHTYEFINRGTVDLVIETATACECTTVDYSTKPVKPGQKGYIKIVFDSTEKDVNETIDIDILLQNNEPETGNPIMEMLRFTYDLVKK
jgi:peptidoglycan-associated lipoprotein